MNLKRINWSLVAAATWLRVESTGGLTILKGNCSLKGTFLFKAPSCKLFMGMFFAYFKDHVRLRNR